MPDQERFIVDVVSSDEELAHVFRIREEVFVQEQKVPPELERDHTDETAFHFLGRLDGKEIGAARLRLLNDQEVKIERVAISAQFRNAGRGREMMVQILEFASKLNMQSVVLHAQLSATNLYRRLGFVEIDPPFTEAGIQHQKMRRYF